ncbi:InlB B-repeat-containing protein [Treponema maltophilum]|uniref:InlB B-repeat-containing protein n=1 Tax=Treponema maltophilum TaxID=51160 RepID=UPI003D911AEA
MKKCMIVATVLAVVLIALTGCPNPAGGNKTPVPVPPPAPANYKVTFAATDTNGTLGATVDRTAITSGNKIAVGKTVAFTAKPNEGYVVDKWVITGGTFEAGTGKDGSDTAMVEVGSSDIEVKVSFKAAAPGKHVLTFKVKGEAGGSTITAKVTDGGDIFSGNEIENGKEVEFTATPDTANGWKVKSWSIVKTADNTALSFVSGTGADGSNTAKALINEPVTVEVEFEKIKHPVTFSVDGAGGALTAKMGDTVINTGNGVEHGKTVEFTAKPASNGWKVKDWSIVKTADGTPLTFANITINQNNGVGNAYAKITEPVTVKVTFEQQFAVTFAAVHGNGTLTAKHDGKDFVSSTRLTAGKTVEFTAEPRTGYVIDKWTITGGTFKAGGTDGSSTATVEVGSSNVEVKVNFKWMGEAFKPNTSYKGDIKLSCWIAGMGGVDFGAGQPDKGEKYKSLLEDAHITVDGTGNATLTAKFRKSMVKIYGIDANVFIDPRNSTPGYYDMGGNKVDAVFTKSSGEDKAIDPKNEKVHYVNSMSFPVSKEASVYHLWVYVNSEIMGVQFCDGANIDNGNPNEPNKSTKYVGKITIDWSTLTEE